MNVNEYGDLNILLAASDVNVNKEHARSVMPILDNVSDNPGVDVNGALE